MQVINYQSSEPPCFNFDCLWQIFQLGTNWQRRGLSGKNEYNWYILITETWRTELGWSHDVLFVDYTRTQFHYTSQFVKVAPGLPIIFYKTYLLLTNTAQKYELSHRQVIEMNEIWYFFVIHFLFSCLNDVFQCTKLQNMNKSCLFSKKIYTDVVNSALYKYKNMYINIPIISLNQCILIREVQV